MCGLAAIFAYRNEAPPVDQDELLRIREHMFSRGPDGAGLWVSEDRRIGLGHRRLAILDISEAGAQPMSTSDGTVRIVFNGEIYNYREQRKFLEAKGYHFRSNSDTEVLLALYQEYGSELVHHLRGMYAFAIWDEKRRGLFLARDPFGIKPLYISDDGKTLRIASQVKALLAGGRIDTAPEPAGHAGFFLWGHVPEPFTLYRGVSAVKPGTSLWVDTTGQKSIRQFFDLTSEIEKNCEVHLHLTRAEIRERIRTALLDSVSHHMIADVPVGVFLSAGVDSSTITALARETGLVADLRTVTLGFREFVDTPADEVPVAQLVARRYGSQHFTHWTSKQDFSQAIDEVLAVMDQPSIDGINSYFVCKAAKEAKLKVVLSGLGGDELFAGYSDFQQIPRMVSAAKLLQGVPWLGIGFRHLSARLFTQFSSPKFAGLLEYGGTTGGAYLLRRGLYMPWELPNVLDRDLAIEGLRALQTLNCLNKEIGTVSNSHLQVTALETAWYMRNQTLRDMDWASMAHSLEVRVPLVDIELFKVAIGIIGAGNTLTKQDLMATISRPLPNEVTRRPKTGFSVPVQSWVSEAIPSRNSFSTRGLRGWACIVYQYRSALKQEERVNLKNEKATRVGLEANSPKATGQWRIGLLASEVCTRGGIQSFMVRVLEVISVIRADDEAAVGYCLSLNDRTEDLRGNSNIPTSLAVKGANRSKFELLLYSILFNGRTDILVVGHIALSPVASLLKILGRVKNYYVILHGIEAWRRLPILQHFAARGATGILTTTRYTAAEFARYNKISLNRISIIPLCADERRVVPTFGFRLNGKFKLLCVARLDASERYKGFEQLFRALDIIKLKHPAIHLNLVGAGNDTVRLQTVVRQRGLEPQVSFLGSLSDNDLAAAYEDCDVFVMPSKKEGFGIVFLEAMLRSKPCIGGNHGGTPDVIEHGQNGYLVNYGDIDALVNAILELYSNGRLRLDMGLRSFDLVNGKFSVAKFISSYRQVLLKP